MNEETKPLEEKQTKPKPIVTILILILILIVGASFRLMNNNWDESFHLHPDERFLSQVITQIRPVSSFSEYFDTNQSNLNPNTHGFTYFVYGTFPLFIIRYLGQWTNQLGYDLNTLLGREISAVMDVWTILLVFLIAFKLYNERAGLIATALYALAVLPIQQSHFMTVDTFTNTFGMLTVLAAVHILTAPVVVLERKKAASVFKILAPCVLFGLGLGMATACKINAVSLAILLPLVETIRFYRKEKKPLQILRELGVAAAVSFLTFRVLQPYAFSGPGFFNLGINQDWWLGLRGLQAQARGEVDFPPALQWVRRPATFSLSNLLIWGIGLPWGIMAVLSWLGMGWKIFRNKELRHLPIWSWMLLYYLWQGLAWVSSMRYLLLLYPLLAVVTAWALDKLIRQKAGWCFRKFSLSSKRLSQCAMALTVFVLTATAAWAFAFTRIYTKPVTRVEASEWIYQNFEGPINLTLQSGEQTQRVPAQYRAYTILTSGQELPLTYSTPVGAYVMELTYPVVRTMGSSETPVEYYLEILDAESGQKLNETPFVASNPIGEDGLTLQAVLNFNLNQTIRLEAGRLYQFVLSCQNPETQAYISGAPTLNLYRDDGLTLQEALPKIYEVINPTHAYSMRITLTKTGEITRVDLPMVLDNSLYPRDKTLRMVLTSYNNGVAEAVEATTTAPLLDARDGRGEPLSFELETPLKVLHPQDIELRIELLDGEGEIMISTPGIAFESSWDDALPLALDGLIPFQPDGSGIYRPDLNFEMYWTDDANKRERFYQVLDQADYIVMSSNRQFGTVPRVPERYPLSVHFYRELLNCPDDQDTVVCYNKAESERLNPEFGFDLVKTVTSYPRLGSWEFNDQFAEEAFSVYDHPKVLIFRKNESYDSERMLQLLNEIDISKAKHLSPKEIEEYKPEFQTPESGLMLDDAEKTRQQQGGTWSELFDREALFNRYPWTGVVALYLFLLLLGWAVFPITRLAFLGLRDNGYAFSRIVGLLLFTLIAFNLGSLQITVSRTLLGIVLLAILLVSALVAWFTRSSLKAFFTEQRKLILWEELVFLAAFLLFLWIRFNNPDLWHPWRGGEKPMDFSYLNAAIKSSTFPAYDPWFAGGYINYYYYGQVIVAMPIKLLGIIPAVAYNICLALWYAMLVIGAFSIGWNLTWFGFRSKDKAAPEKLAFRGGLISSLLLAFFGNLGEIKVIKDGLAILGSNGADITQASFGQSFLWTMKGIRVLAQTRQLPIGPGTWYWNPSRTIPGEPITEFPFFTFLYADFHAHLIAMPVVMAAVAWGLSLIMRQKDWCASLRKAIRTMIPVLLVGGMVVGALQPTNTWDYLTFIAFNLIVLVFVIWRDLPPIKLGRLPGWVGKILFSLGLAFILAAVTRILYFNFNSRFLPGYNTIGFWEGARTPIRSYLLHWGLILFLIIWWFAWELHHWLATTKMSAVQPWVKRKNALIAIGVVLSLVLAALLILKVSIAVIAFPLAVAALFLLVTTENDAKRLAYFMIGTGLLLTIVVELVYLVGDVGRMNVVFKLYHQAWMLLTLPLGLAAVVLLERVENWQPRWQHAFQIPLFILLFISLLFPTLASLDKMSDRMSEQAPRTLDGMKYMESSYYHSNGLEMDLGRDYRAIQWMQDHVEGSPVIVEAQTYEYAWGNRFTIYTGLPSVVGWNYHQRQQRAIMRDNQVQERVDELNLFYNSTDREFVSDYIRRYDVQYIIVGQQELAMYSTAGLIKFTQWDGELWDAVYRQEGTAIYKVRQHD